MVAPIEVPETVGERCVILGSGFSRAISNHMLLTPTQNRAKNAN